MKPRDAERSKNFFALGLISWMYTRPIEPIDRVDRASASPSKQHGPRRQPRRVQGRATTSARPPSSSTTRTRSQPAQLPPGHVPQHHRQRRARRTASSPPRSRRSCRSSTRRTRSRRRPTSSTSSRSTRTSACARCRPRTRSPPSASRSARAFAGQLGVTATSGPGVDLKSEALGLAISLELPLVLVDVQRGGPSTGLPTKTEQADLLLAMYGRHGEAPLPIVAAQSPSHCFDAAFEAVRIALKYRTPVILLTDGYLANGAEPWLLPDVDALPDISVPFAEPNHEPTARRVLALPARPRDARPPVGDPGHARPHAPHRWHREAGRHRQRQLRPRQPRAHGPHPGREDRRHRRTTSRWSRSTTPTATPSVLVLGWGSTWGSISEAVRRVRAAGQEGGARAPRPPEPVPAEPRRGARRATRRCWSPR